MYIYILLLLVTLMSVAINEKISKSPKLIKKDEKYAKFYFLPFLILALFSALRYGIGVDYLTYGIHIRNIQASSALFNPNMYMEIGFQVLVKFCCLITDDPIFVMIVMAVLTNFFFLKAIYEQSDNIKLSIFIYITWGYYFFTFNSIRSYLAISLALYSIRYIKYNKYIQFVIIILIASLFHKSVLICLPFYIIANRKLKSVHFIYGILILIAIVLLKNQIETLIFKIYPSYLGSVYDVDEVSYLNILKGLAVTGLGLIFYKSMQEKKIFNFYFNLNFFALLIYCLGYWIPQVSRIGFYFNISSIIFIPSFLENLYDSRIRILGKYICIVLSCGLFIILMIGFYDPALKLLPYESWCF